MVATYFGRLIQKGAVISVDDYIGLIYDKAKSNPVFLEEIVKTTLGNNALYDFCAYAQKHGINVTPGYFLTVGETYSCNQLKSTNGGGVNPYMYFDDPFEMLCVQLESLLIDKQQ